MLSSSVPKIEREFPWQVAKSTGNHFMRLPERRVITILNRYGKWNYAVQLEGLKNAYRNGFSSEAEAMRAAEEDYGHLAVQPEQPSTTRAPAKILKIVPRPQREELKLEPEVEVQREEERQVRLDEVVETQAGPSPSANRQVQDYVNALCGKDSSAWGQVLWLTKIYKNLRTISLVSSMSIDEIKKLLNEYDPEIVKIEIQDSSVSLELRGVEEQEPAYA